jgi:hypothetical protein
MDADNDRNVAHGVTSSGESAELGFDPRRPPTGDTLQLRTEGDCLIITVEPSHFPVGCAAISGFLLGCGLGLALVVAFGAIDLSGEYALLGVVVAFAGLGGIALAIAARVVGEVLTVAPEEVTKFHTSPWGDFAGKRICAADVKEVIIAEHPRNSSLSSVKITGEEAVVHFGSSLDDEEKAWVRDCITAVIGVGSQCSGS